MNVIQYWRFRNSCFPFSHYDLVRISCFSPTLLCSRKSWSIHIFFSWFLFCELWYYIIMVIQCGEIINDKLISEFSKNDENVDELWRTLFFWDFVDIFTLKFVESSKIFLLHFMQMKWNLIKLYHFQHEFIWARTLESDNIHDKITGCIVLQPICLTCFDSVPLKI